MSQEPGGTEKGPETLASEVDRTMASLVVIPTFVPALLPRQALMLASCGALIRDGALADAYAALGRFEADLRDADRHHAKELLGLVSAWLQVNIATKEAWIQAEASTMESKREIVEARAARDDALAEAAAAVKRCSEAEANLKALQEEQASSFSSGRTASRPVR